MLTQVWLTKLEAVIKVLRCRFRMRTSNLCAMSWNSHSVCSGPVLQNLEPQSLHCVHYLLSRKTSVLVSCYSRIFNTCIFNLFSNCPIWHVYLVSLLTANNAHMWICHNSSQPVLGQEWNDHSLLISVCVWELVRPCACCMFSIREGIQL